MTSKFDWGYEEAQRLAALEEERGEIGGGGSAIGGWAQSHRRHNEAIAALHALSDVCGMIADHAVVASLAHTDSAHVRFGSEVMSVVLTAYDREVIDGTPCHRWTVCVGGARRLVYDGDAYPIALRALRAAVDARLAGADRTAVYVAAQRAANGGEQ